MKIVQKPNNTLKKVRRTYFKGAFILLLVFTLVMGTSLVAFATSGNGVAQTLTSFMDILVSVIKIIGVILTLWGVVNFFLAMQSHDPNQRMSGVLLMVAGLFIFFADTILSAIGVTI